MQTTCRLKASFESCSGISKYDGYFDSCSSETIVVLDCLFYSSYLNFVECLRYLQDDLVTNDLMQYAVSLVSGFDDIVDDPVTGDELKPTRVNIREVFIGESNIGKGNSLWNC